MGEKYTEGFEGWCAQRFTKIDEDNATIQKTVAAVHETVNRHAVYWDVTKWSIRLGLPGGLAALWFWLTQKH